MGFFSDLKDDLSQAFNELNDQIGTGGRGIAGEQTEAVGQPDAGQVPTVKELVDVGQVLTVKEPEASEQELSLNEMLEKIETFGIPEEFRLEASDIEPEGLPEELRRTRRKEPQEKDIEEELQEDQPKGQEKSMRRILLKLSGEALAGEKRFGFDEETVRKVALQVGRLVNDGIQVGIVIGGGNFWRGRTSENIDRTKADQIGMLATVMNCIYVSEIFRSVGMRTNILTPFECGAFTKLFSKDRANKYFEEGQVVFFAGGTGHPYFSTDTGVVLRAIEVEADVILLAKSIDGVYDDDPNKNPAARRYDEVTIDEVIAKNLQVVDMTASILARDNKMPMWVFKLNDKDSIVNTVKGNFNGTRVIV